MKHSRFKRRTSFPILFIHFLLISHLAFSQTNSNVKKEGNVGIEPFIVNLGKTIEQEMIRLDSIDDNYLTSPADGLVLQDLETNGPKELGLENKKFTKVSIFMNVFDCHVNRTPCAGKILQIIYKPGKFINASFDKASEENERNYYKVQNSFGEDIIVVQIAGLVARRIVNESHEGQELKQGERIGMIRFGSRADIFFENYKPLVKVNQKTIAGETLIAKK